MTPLLPTIYEFRTGKLLESVHEETRLADHPMNKRSLLIIVSLIVFGGLCWRFFRDRAADQAPSRSAIPAQTLISPAARSTAAVKATLSTAPDGRSKDEMMQAIWAEENGKAQDFYGKVVDQYGEPVAGADVLGTLLWIQGYDVGEKREQHTTNTNQRGEFQFTGFHASRLAVSVSLAGYEMNRRGVAYKSPNPENRTGPSERAIFAMWKLKGAEPMVHTKVHAYVPCDGTATSYNILTGRKAGDGDLVLTLTREPVDIVRGRPFDWKATVELRNGGGVIPINEIYPNEAPADGYVQKIFIEAPATMKDWDAAYERSYYFKSGKIFGRMTISIQADFQPPPTSFDVQIFANPSGSRNLEFDPAKAATPKP